MAEQSPHVKALRENLAQLNAVTPESLARPELGMFSFEEGVPDFARTLDLFTDLARCNLDCFSDGVLNSLNSTAQSVVQRVKQIQEWDPRKVSNPENERSSMIQHWRNEYNTFFQNLAPWISYGMSKSSDPARLEREARGVLAELQEHRDAAKLETEQMVKESKEALKAVQDAAAKTGVAQMAPHFEQEATKHSREAWLWLMVSLLFAGGTLYFAYWSFTHYPGLPEGMHPIAFYFRDAILRVVVISILLYGLVWATRNYGANRHNETVNRHRHRSLGVFETFVKASSDGQTRDAVLLHAARAIFAPLPTAYMNQPDAVQPTGATIEVLERIGAAGGGTPN